MITDFAEQVSDEKKHFVNGLLIGSIATEKLDSDKSLLTIVNSDGNLNVPANVRLILPNSDSVARFYIPVSYLK